MRRWLPILIAIAFTLPGVFLELGVYHASSPIEALIFGIAIISSAFLLSWASEALQVDVSQGLALALLALIAILPEYVVDATFAWLAASDPAYGSYAVANMTGANRLLIGIAWPLVMFLIWFRSRRHHVTLEPAHGLELVTLLAATIYAFIIPFKGNLSMIDLVVLIGIFILYIVRVARLPAEQPHLVGPAKDIGELRPRARRTVIAALGMVAGGVILLVAEPFATALVDTGTLFGIDEFLLVQWLAPLASEAPEFVVVSIFAWRGAATAAFGALISSKVNQWTLLIAMLPLIYAIALGDIVPLPLDDRQQEEILLTAAQSLFAITLLLDLRFSVIGGAALFVLFMIQFIWTDIHVPMIGVYIVAAVVTLFISRGQFGNAFRGARSTRQH